MPQGRGPARHVSHSRHAPPSRSCIRVVFFCLLTHAFSSSVASQSRSPGFHLGVVTGHFYGSHPVSSSKLRGYFPAPIRFAQPSCLSSASKCLSDSGSESPTCTCSPSGNLRQFLFTEPGFRMCWALNSGLSPDLAGSSRTKVLGTCLSQEHGPKSHTLFERRLEAWGLSSRGGRERCAHEAEGNPTTGRPPAPQRPAPRLVEARGSPCHRPPGGQAASQFAQSAHSDARATHSLGCRGPSPLSPASSSWLRDVTLPYRRSQPMGTPGSAGPSGRSREVHPPAPRHPVPGPTLGNKVTASKEQGGQNV